MINFRIHGECDFYQLKALDSIELFLLDGFRMYPTCHECPSY